MSSALLGIRDRVFARPRLLRSARQIRLVRGPSVELAARLAPASGKVEAPYLREERPWTDRGL